MDTLILVNKNDQEVGFCNKYHTHKFGLLHRAFSIMLYTEHKGQKLVLLQQRAQSKYHGGGLWTNACCSHFLPGVDKNKTLQARLLFEMRLQAELNYCGKFHYKAELNPMIENEIDYVYLGKIEHVKPNYNKEEVMHTSWVPMQELAASDLNNRKYSPWFKNVFQICFQSKL